MSSIKLVQPASQYKTSVMAAISELLAEKSNAIEWYYQVEDRFENYVQDLLNRKNKKTDKIVPETILWAVKEDIFVGRISIRHELNENLRKVGGHIGYEVRPSYRKQGIASQMLGLALPFAKKLGLSKVLLTCDESNSPSIRTIEKNNGVFDTKVHLESGKPSKLLYWIEL